MRLRGRMPNQALDATETLGQREDARGLDDFSCARERAELETDHPGEAAHLPARQLVLRVGRQARIIHSLDPGMLLEVLRNAQSVTIVSLHAYMQRLGAA